MKAIGISLTLQPVSMYVQLMMGLAKELVLGALLLGTVYYDLRLRVVPNPLIAVSLIAGLVLRFCEGIGSLIRTMLLALMLSWPFYQGYRRGWRGGGDVKLVAATSLLAGEGKAIAFFLAGVMAGGLVSLFGILQKKKGDRLADRSGTKKPADRSVVMVPYAAAYSLGVLVFRIVGLVVSKG